MSFDIGHLKFIDSFQCMASSLDTQVEHLKDDNYYKFKCMKSEFGDHMDLLCRKLSYLYEWFDNVNKFEHNGLPNIKSFYSPLSQKGINEKQYEHATNVYNKLNCQSFKYYHLAYLNM